MGGKDLCFVYKSVAIRAVGDPAERGSTKMTTWSDEANSNFSLVIEDGLLTTKKVERRGPF